MSKLSHYDAAGRATMVDVPSKTGTRPTARAQAFVKMRPAVLRQTRFLPARLSNGEVAPLTWAGSADWVRVLVK